MLEAALLGIPYEGRIPDFSQSEVPEPLSPSVLQQRILREEQDQAYQDSLQVLSSKHFSKLISLPKDPLLAGLPSF